MITLHWIEQGTEAWKKIRRGLWTGSVAIRLLQGKSLPRESDWDGFKDAALRGHALEFAMIREYERKYRRKIQRPGFVTNSVYPNAGFSPDGLDGGWLIEMKAFLGVKLQDLINSKAGNYDDLIASKIPLEVKCQILFGMIITGKRKARLLAIDPDAIDREQLTVIEVTYDVLIGDNIRSKLRADLKKRLASGSVADELGLVRIEA